jgi:hypothetical protein
MLEGGINIKFTCLQGLHFLMEGDFNNAEKVYEDCIR